MRYYVCLEAEGYPLTDLMEFDTLEDAKEHAEEMLRGITIRIEDEEGEQYYD